MAAFWTGAGAGFGLSSFFFSSDLSAFWTGGGVGFSSFFFSAGLSAFCTSFFFSSGLSAFCTGAAAGFCSFFFSSGCSAFWTGGGVGFSSFFLSFGSSAFCTGRGAGFSSFFLSSGLLSGIAARWPIGGTPPAIGEIADGAIARPLETSAATRLASRSYESLLSPIVTLRCTPASGNGAALWPPAHSGAAIAGVDAGVPVSRPRAP